MKAVFFSDIHLHNSKLFSRVLDSGVNSRLQDEINILYQILDYCKINNVSRVFFCGDLFHNGESIPPDILSLLIDTLQDFNAQGISIKAIPGQHDNLNAHFNGLDPLDDYMTVLPNGAAWNIGGIAVYSCYHRRGIENQKEALRKIRVKEGVKSIFVGHFLLKEILEAQGVPYANQAVEFADLPRGCDHYFLGDYHPHVYLPDLKVMSVGSTHHHTWGSKNKPPGGFIVMDFSTGEFERVLLKAPMFVEVEIGKEPPSNLFFEDFPSDYWKENFFRIHVESMDQRDMIKANLDDSWHVEFVFDGVEVKEEVTPDDRPDIHFNLQPYEVITKYLLHKDRDPELVKEGMKYVIIQ